MCGGGKGAAALILAITAGCALGSGDGNEGTVGLGGTAATGDAGDGGGDDGDDDGASDDGTDAGASGEGPDDGNLDGPSPTCGDGFVDLAEECDDANADNGDGCNTDCRISGQLQWQHIVPGTGLFDDEAWDVAEAPDGSLYVSGFVRDAEGTPDGWLRKLNPLGGLEWTQTHASSSGGNDQMRALAVDTAGLVYIAGFQGVTGEGANAWVRQYDELGEALWTDGYDGPGSGSDSANSIVLDAFGDLLVAGHHTGAEGRDVLLRKYATDGTVAWTRSYAGPAAADDQAYGVATTPEGQIYVVGSENAAGEGKNAWLGKYDVDGNLLWSRAHNGDAGLDDELRAVVATPDGVVVCGFDGDEVIGTQSFVRAYDDEGEIVWTELFPGGTMEGALCLAIARDPGGDLVWGGGEAALAVRHILLRRLDADGVERWTTRLPAMADGPDDVRGVTVTADGEIIVAGRIDTGDDGLDPWVASFTP